MSFFKQVAISWLLITSDPACKLASARPEYLGGRSTKDDGVKGLRALPTFNHMQEGIEGTFLGGYEAPKVEAQDYVDEDMIDLVANAKDDTSGTVPKAVGPGELHQLIQALQKDFAATKAKHADEMAELKATYTNEMTKMKETHAEEMAKMKATIQANHEAHNEERRLGVRQDLNDMIEVVNEAVAAIQENADSIESINANLQTLMFGSTVSALQAGLTAAQACCANNAATIESIDATVQDNVAAVQGINANIQDIIIFINSL